MKKSRSIVLMCIALLGAAITWSGEASAEHPGRDLRRAPSTDRASATRSGPPRVFLQTGQVEVEVSLVASEWPEVGKANRIEYRDDPSVLTTSPSLGASVSIDLTSVPNPASLTLWTYGRLGADGLPEGDPTWTRSCSLSMQTDRCVGSGIRQTGQATFVVSTVGSEGAVILVIQAEWPAPDGSSLPFARASWATRLKT
jgi:hypothetical protein